MNFEITKTGKALRKPDSSVPLFPSLSGRLRNGFLWSLTLALLIQTPGLGGMGILSAEAAGPAKVPSVTVPTVPKNGFQYIAKAPTFPVAVCKSSVTDASRKRPIPLVVYYPANGTGPFPVIIFSHGLGGNAENYDYFGKFMANKGYVVIHPEHVGSNTQAVFGGSVSNADASKAMAALSPQQSQNILGAAYQNAEAINRTQDVSFVIDSLSAIEGKIPALKGKVNGKVIGMGGHSFGSLTSGLLSGLKLTPPGSTKPLDLSDKRLSAFLLMSPDGANTLTNKAINYDVTSYQQVKAPMMFLSGEKDTLFFLINPITRLDPFKHSPATGNKYQGFLNESTHFDFAGGYPPGFNSEGYANALNNTMNDGHAFFDAYLKQDPVAVNYLKTKLKSYVQSSQSGYWAK